jgi:hypothetical protein
VRRGALGALLALALGLGIVHWRQQTLASPHVRYDRFDLPGFDAHVYVAMAEQPPFFTVAPWGYRLLTPWVVHALPAGNVARGFRWVTVGAMGAASALLFLYLRRLGFTPAAGLLGSAALALSGPVGEAARYRFLVEPLTLALLVAYLLAIEAGAGAGALGLIALLGVLNKEFFVLLLPLPWLLRRGREGDARAARAALLAAAPAVAALVALRALWAAHPSLAGALPGLGTMGTAVERFATSWREWAVAALLTGLMPLALLGALRPAARPWRLPAAYLALVTVVPPFLNPVAFFPADIPRLLLYVLPLAIPLALLALDRLRPLLGPPPPAASPGPRWIEAACGLGAVGVLVAVLAGIDPYRRWDLRGPRDGPRLLALCRETLRAARRLERGQAVVLEADAHRFVWGQSDPGDLSRMRWFLGDGWGEKAHYATGDIVMAADEATLVVPVLTPRDLPLALQVDAARITDLELRLDDRPLAQARVGPGPSTVRATLPRSGLFRGDNVLRLRAVGGGVCLRVYGLGEPP